MRDGDSVYLVVRQFEGQKHVEIIRRPSGIGADSGPCGATMGQALEWAWRALTCGTEEEPPALENAK